MSYLKSVYGLVKNGSDVDVQNIDGHVVHSEKNSNLDPASFDAAKTMYKTLRGQLPAGSEIVPSGVFEGLRENGPVVVYSHAVEHIPEGEVYSESLPLEMVKENVVTTKADFKRNIAKLGLQGVTADKGVFDTRGGYALYGESNDKTQFVKVHSIDGVKPGVEDLKVLMTEMKTMVSQARPSMRRVPSASPGM